MKRRYADPSPPIEGVQGELFRNERTNRGGRKTPMSEKKVAPNLGHDPGALREAPGGGGPITRRGVCDFPPKFCENGGEWIPPPPMIKKLLRTRGGGVRTSPKK